MLESLARSQSGAHREVVRAKALLMAADGVANAAIAARVSVSRPRWRTGVLGSARMVWSSLGKSGSRGRKPSIPDATIEKIVASQGIPPTRPDALEHTNDGPRGWVSKSTVALVWKELGLKPHRIDTFKVSNDPKFDEKLVDVVGLYLNPPDNAIVLCADEKSSVQASTAPRHRYR